jgi:hypothetical protein
VVVHIVWRQGICLAKEDMDLDCLERSLVFLGLGHKRWLASMSVDWILLVLSKEIL